MAENAVEMKGVSFAYPSHPAKKVLDGISLDIQAGEFVGIVGGTGAGKSTLLYCMNGVIPHLVHGKMAGEVRVGGKNTGKHGPSSFAGRVGILFQDPDSQLFALTVREEVEFGLKNLGFKEKEREERIRKALKETGLEGLEDENPRELSVGQRQKVALASVLAMEPEILLLDEPVSSLDWRSGHEIYELLRKMNKSGKTIIVVEHNTEWLAEYAKRLVGIGNGSIVVDGKPDEVLSDGKAKEMGLKIPCSVEISHDLGLGFVAVTPRKLATLMRGK